MVRLLGFDILPQEVARKEVAYYLTKQNRYGLPLDSRRAYTKLDWILWTATMAEKPQDFEALSGLIIGVRPFRMGDGPKG